MKHVPTEGTRMMLTSGLAHKDTSWLCCLFVLQLNHVHTFEYM